MNKNEYGLHSKFDIKKHKQTFINYCEAIILPSGEIQYAVPSHVEKLIKITGKSREEIYELMPISASPIDWLLKYTNCISVWNDFYIGKPKTEAQKKALSDLIKHGLTKNIQ